MIKSLFASDDKYGWSSINGVGYKLSIIGNNMVVNSVIDYFEHNKLKIYGNMSKFLESLASNFAFVYQDEHIVIATVDRISSYNIFYDSSCNTIQFSNSSRLLAQKHEENIIDNSSLLQLRMSGYVLGGNTILKNIRKIGAGEYACYDKNKKKLEIEEYTRFYSHKPIARSQDDLIEEIDYITDKIFLRNIDNANGATIWVPLSGGIDSRLVLCKLLQLGYDNIRTFSFGVPNNYDALRAQEVAKRLNVDWTFLPPTSGHLKSYYSSKDRRNYWRYADGLFTVPNLQWMYAMRELIRLGEMSHGDVIINGNSGDFITGQNTPMIDSSDSSHSVNYKIIQKHLGFNSELLNKSTTKSIIDNLIDVPHNGVEQLVKLYDLWEWKERQSKRVVNAQRNYEYLGLRWELPLWDKEYFDFWRELSIEHKNHGQLYFNYLERKDFYGLFKGYKPFMSRWPRNRLYIQLIGSIIKYTLGSSLSKKYYKRLDWYSNYQFLYQYIGKEKFLSKHEVYRGFLPHYVDTWISENIVDNKFINKY
jgi:asparagine synthase (glutamine-hydrolysing)